MHGLTTIQRKQTKKLCNHNFIDATLIPINLNKFCYVRKRTKHQTYQIVINLPTILSTQGKFQSMTSKLKSNSTIKNWYKTVPHAISKTETNTEANLESYLELVIKYLILKGLTNRSSDELSCRFRIVNILLFFYQ